MGALALGFASLAARTLFRGKPAPAGLKALSPREAAVLDILSLVYFPPGIGLGLDARQAGMVPYLDGYVSTLGAGERKLMRAMLLAFDQGTLLAGKWTPAHRLDLAAATAYMRDCETSRIKFRRDLAAGLRSLLSFAYFSHPTVLAKLGVERPCRALGPTFRSAAA